jgi:hypothetical protein
MGGTSEIIQVPLSIFYMENCEWNIYAKQQVASE